MALTLIQNVALIVMLATVQRYAARRLSAYPRLALLTAGLLYGGLAIIGMMTPFHFAPGIFYDGRSIILSLSGLFGGAPVALIAGVVASTYRIAVGGVGVAAGVTTMLVSAALGVAVRYAYRDRVAEMGIPALLAFGFVVHLGMLIVQYFLLPDGVGSTVVREIGPVVITLFPLGTALTARLIIEQLEREQARIDLAREAERLRLAMMSADEGTWDLDLQTNTIRFSAEASVLMDRNAGEDSLEDWVATIHHDDRAEVTGILDSVRANEASDVHVFYRQRINDASYRWFQALGTVIERDSAGMPLHLLGVLADIHATRQATQAAAQRAVQAELLAAAGARLINCQDEECVFEVIRDFFAATFPSDIVVINEVAADRESLAMREIIGVAPALITRAERLIGHQVVGHLYPLTPTYRTLLMSGRMECVEGGLAAAAADEFPEAIGKALEHLLGLHTFWSVGIADAGEARAGVHVITRRPDIEIPTGVVESFAQLCFVTFARIDAVDLLAESEARFRTLVETAPEAIYVQTDMHFAYMNDEACRLYGARSCDDLIGQPVMDRFRPDYRDVILSRIKAFELDPRPRRGMESVHLRLDGSEIPVEVSSSPIIYEGREAAVVFVRDTTEAQNAARELERHRDHLEELVAERTRELESANADLEQATRAKSAFLARMSHEFRTPLNSIIGFSSVLVDGLAGPLSAEQRHQIGLINASGRHLLAIISDLLDLSRVEAGRTRIEVHEIDPAVLISEVAEVLRPLAAENGLEMRAHVRPGVPLMRSDSGKIRQILLNLGGNAVKFTETGYVELGLDRGEDDTLVFSVKDTGRGIRSDLLASIFESFAQGDTPADDVPRGTGLGLAISREYARLLGGDVAVTSEPGEGSTFTLTLPRVHS